MPRTTWTTDAATSDNRADVQRFAERKDERLTPNKGYGASDNDTRNNTQEKAKPDGDYYRKTSDVRKGHS